MSSPIAEKVLANRELVDSLKASLKDDWDALADTAKLGPEHQHAFALGQLSRAALGAIYTSEGYNMYDNNDADVVDATREVALAVAAEIAGEAGDAEAK